QCLDGELATQEDLGCHKLCTITIWRQRRVGVLSLLRRDRDLERMLLSEVALQGQCHARDFVSPSTWSAVVTFRSKSPSFLSEDVILVRLLLDIDSRQEELTDESVIGIADAKPSKDSID